ncbi:MAG: hypothetical protein VB144_13475 [Clostridia bacterium]|nr:hypothetical protein [Clostridia bacterium]
MSQAERLLEWKARIAEFRASGLSGSKWCEKNGFRKKQFFYWLAKFKEADTQLEAPAQWLQVQACEPEALASTIEIRIGKATVEVKPDFDPQLLVRIVRALDLC